MERNGLICAHTRAIPPVHRVNVNLSTPGQPPTEFVIADFFATAVVREDRIGDQSDNRALIASHRRPPWPDQQAIQKSTDTGESSRKLPVENIPVNLSRL
jgi:hypothetical protein